MKLQFSESHKYIMSNLEKSAKIYREIDDACEIAVNNIETAIVQHVADISIDETSPSIVLDEEYQLHEHEIICFNAIRHPNNERAAVQLGITSNNEGDEGYSDFSLLGVGRNGDGDCAVFIDLRSLKEEFKSSGKQAIIDFEERELERLSSAGFVRYGSRKGAGYYYKPFELSSDEVTNAMSTSDWSKAIKPITDAIESMMKIIDWRKLRTDIEQLS